ncbi:hypothetical protein [Bacillus sp. V5-8f]|uniref:hypothetical protein n=1 Tax=Bacillus sp. V5-8f TaxID=2053044 RepID=UPI000C7749FF|nr:hypothetical protein [Bacillus sp. V5-8f]PLT31992.1 hypothetical protein CUU64_20615 [Bacillus sp. V5-8f]
MEFFKNKEDMCNPRVDRFDLKPTGIHKKETQKKHIGLKTKQKKIEKKLINTRDRTAGNCYWVTEV